jgi:hypothetical protein
VAAQDAFNNTITAYNGTVQFSSLFTAGGTSSSTLPANTTLLSGTGTFSATLKAPGAQTINVTDSVNNVTGSSNTIASRGLVVTNLSPTPTGFVANFNKAFDPAQLNLFDALNTYGASDVTLVSGNAIENITFGGTITGGSFTLSFKGATTGPIVYSSNASSLIASIQSALDSLSTVGSGNTLLGGNATSVSVTFQNALGLAFQPLLAATSSLTGASPAVSTASVTQATLIRGTLLIDSTNTSVTFVKTGTGVAGLLSAGSYALTFRSATDGFKDTSGSSLGFLDGNNDGVAGDNYVTTITVANTPNVMLNIPDFARGPDSNRNVRVPNNTGTATQNITFSSGTSGGTFTLALNGFNNGSYSRTTGPISYSTAPSTLVSNIQAALIALTSPISGAGSNAGNTLVSGSTSTSVSIVFQSDLGGANQPNLVLTSSLTGSSPSATVSTTVAGVNLGIPITLTNVAGVTDVTFTLTYNPLELTIPATNNTFNASTSSTLSVVGTPSGGVVNFIFHSNTPLSGTALLPLTLGQIVAQVPSAMAASYKSKELLHLSNTLINGQAVGNVNAISLANVTGGSFTLAFKGATTGPIAFSATQATLQGNIQSALDTLGTVGLGNSTVVAASASLFVIYFQNSLGASAQPTITLASSGLTGPAPTIAVGNGVNNDGVHVVAYFGDTSGDGIVSSGDGSLISRVIGGLDSNVTNGVFGGLAAFKLADPVIVADVTGNGTVDASDVVLINQFTSGTQQTRLPPIPTGLTIVPTGPDPTLSLPTDLKAARGQSVVVPVNLDTARPEGSTGLMEAILALKYDPSVFTVSAQDIHLGTLPGSNSGWKLQAVVNAQTGEIGIDLFSPTPIVTTGGGSLVTLTLHVLDTAPAGASGINLVRMVNPTGQRAYVTTAADAAGAFILHPAVTDGNGDEGVDGIVSVPTAGQTLASVDNVPQTFYVAPAVSSGAALEAAPSLASVSSSGHELALGLMERIFGDLEAAGVLLRDSELSQPGAVMDTDLSGKTHADHDLAALTQALDGATDWLPDDYVAYLGQKARRNAKSLLSDLLEGEQAADADGVAEFFARESRSGNN